MPKFSAYEEVEGGKFFRVNKEEGAGPRIELVGPGGNILAVAGFINESTGELTPSNDPRLALEGVAVDTNGYWKIGVTA